MLNTAHRLALAALALAPLAHAQPVHTEPRPTAEEIKTYQDEIAASDVMRRFGVAEAPARTPGAIRVATYNIENLFDDADDPALTDKNDDADDTKLYPERMAAARAIHRLDADVLCLEEVESLDALNWFKDEFLADMGYQHVASIDAGDERGIEQAVLSRLPITQAKNWPRMPLKGIHPEKYGNGKNWYAGQPIAFHRSPLMVDIEAGTPDNPLTLTLFVVHHKSGQYSDYWREAESVGVTRLISDLTKQHPDRPVMVLGDFNAQVSDTSVKTYLSAGFHDIFANRSQTSEIITHESSRRIDLILANDAAMTHLIADKAFVLGTAARPEGVDWRDLPTFPGMASDHYPVAVDFVPTPAAPTDAKGG